jgi:hypothetical protein
MIYITLMLVVHATIQLALVLDIYLGNGASRSEEWWFNADATIAVVVNHPLNTHFLFLDHHREYTSNPEEIHNSFFVPESYGRNSDI